METYCRPGKEVDDNTIRRVCFACCMTEAGDTHSEYVILLLFHRNNSYANVSQYFVIRIMPAWLVSVMQCSLVNRFRPLVTNF